MTRNLPGLVAVFLLSPSVPAEPTPADPTHQHLMLAWDGSRPRVPLRLFETPEAKGEPAAILDDRGLSFHGETLCTWKLGNYELEKAAAKTEADCGLPLRAGGDHYTPLLLLEVAGDDGEVARVAWAGRKLYVDSGAYREAQEMRSTKKKRVEPKIEEIERTDPSYSAFLSELRACLDSPASLSGPGRVKRVCHAGRGCPEAAEDQPIELPKCIVKLMAESAPFHLRVEQGGPRPLDAGDWAETRRVLLLCLGNARRAWLPVGPDIVYLPSEEDGSCILERRNARWMVQDFAMPD